MMKRITLISIMALFTIVAVAQTSRRQGNVSNESKQEQKNKQAYSTRRSTDPDKKTNTPAQVERKASTSTSNSSSPSGNTNRTYQKPKTTVRTPASTSTNQTHRNNNNNPQNRVHSNEVRSDNRNKTYAPNNNRSTHNNNHVTVRKNRTHSDVVYSTPRKHYRVYSYNPGHNKHYNYYYKKPYYRTPHRVNTYWNVSMYHDYRVMYPFVKVWHIPYGTRIETIPSYDADFHVGEVNRVYGKVKNVYYAADSDEYYLYFGNEFPYQHFTVIMPGYVARTFSNRPGRFFDHEYISVTGYISEYDGRPELLVSKKYQVDIY